MTTFSYTPITNGATSDVAHVNTPFTNLANIINGAIDAGNLAADAVGNSELAPNAVTNTEVAAAAAIAYSKLNLVGSLVNADVAAAAAILISKLAAGVDGNVIQTVGGVPTWVDPEVAYNEFTAPVNITATTEPTANTVVSSGFIVYEAVPHLIEFSAPHVQPDAAAAGRSLIFTLWDGSTILGRIGIVRTPAANTLDVPVYRPVRVTPTAGSHTYIVKALVSAGTGIVSAGVGGEGVNMPGFIRISRV